MRMVDGDKARCGCVQHALPPAAGPTGGSRRAPVPAAFTSGRRALRPPR